MSFIGIDAVSVKQHLPAVLFYLPRDDREYVGKQIRTARQIAVQYTVNLSASGVDDAADNALVRVVWCLRVKKGFQSRHRDAWQLQDLRQRSRRRHADADSGKGPRPDGSRDVCQLFLGDTAVREQIPNQRHQIFQMVFCLARGFLAHQNGPLRERGGQAPVRILRMKQGDGSIRSGCFNR